MWGLGGRPLTEAGELSGGRGSYFRVRRFHLTSLRPRNILPCTELQAAPQLRRLDLRSQSPESPTLPGQRGAGLGPGEPPRQCISDLLPTFSAPPAPALLSPLGGTQGVWGRQSSGSQRDPDALRGPPPPVSLTLLL